MPNNFSNEDLDIIAHALKVVIQKHRGQSSAVKSEANRSKSPDQDRESALAKMNLFKDCLDRVNAERTKDGRIPPKMLTAKFETIQVSFPA